MSFALTPGPRPGHFTASADATWGQGRATFGGLLAAWSLDALARADGRPLRSFVASFVAPVAPGEVEVSVEPLRSGRSLLQAEARVIQGGSTAFVMLASLGEGRPTRLAWPSAPPNPVTAADSGLEFPFVPGLTPNFTQHFAYRWSAGALPFSGAATPDFEGWVRLRQDRPLDGGTIACLLDAWPAPILGLAQRPTAASSVTWMANLAPLPQQEDRNQWCFFRSRALASTEGYADIDSALWTADGRLLATSRQLVAEFSG